MPTIFVSEVVPLMSLAIVPAVSRATWHGPSNTAMLGISSSRGSLFFSVLCCTIQNALPGQHDPRMRLKSMSPTEGHRIGPLLHMESFRAQTCVRGKKISNCGYGSISRVVYY